MPGAAVGGEVGAVGDEVVGGPEYLSTCINKFGDPVPGLITVFFCADANRSLNAACLSPLCFSSKRATAPVT